MSRPPGRACLAFAERWCAPETVAQVFEPLVADWQREWTDAPRFRRAWIRLHGMAAFLTVMLSVFPRLMLSTSMPAPMTRRVLSRIIIVTGVGSALLTVPFLLDMRELPAQAMVVAVASLLPAGVALSFPFAMAWVADAIRRHRTATPLERVAAVRVGTVAVAFSIAFIGWGVPAANQQFRVVAAPDAVGAPARGVRELTLSELIAERASPSVDGRYTRNGSRGAARRELNNRVVIALLPALLLWVRWGAHDGSRKRWFSPLPVAVETMLTLGMFFVLYLASVMTEPTLGLQPGSGLWIPLAALLLAGTIRRSLSRRGLA